MTHSEGVVEVAEVVATVVVDVTMAQIHDERGTGTVIVRRPYLVTCLQMALQRRPKGRKFMVVPIIATIPTCYKV